MTKLYPQDPDQNHSTSPWIRAAYARLDRYILFQ